MKLAHLPLRASIGAYFLDSGLGKRNLEAEAAQAMHGMAVAALPQLGQLDPPRFAKLLSYSEIALGAALLAPARQPPADPAGGRAGQGRLAGRRRSDAGAGGADPRPSARLTWPNRGTSPTRCRAT
jgi:hypothetical protein